ncbi:hypothetical protein SBA3_2760009 [Candidatus Sulfopaludibacter sp. SbA3]|nr:hypothetical protein SBA3_2760009 [Candidatus Sulfopaludibacter sp. SbA3]
MTTSRLFALLGIEPEVGAAAAGAGGATLAGVRAPGVGFTAWLQAGIETRTASKPAYLIAYLQAS